MKGWQLGEGLAKATIMDRARVGTKIVGVLKYPHDTRHPVWHKVEILFTCKY